MNIKLIAVSQATALKAQRQVLGCKSCTDEAEILLCWVLDRVTGRSGANSDYGAVRAAEVPQVRGRGY